MEKNRMREKLIESLSQAYECLAQIEELMEEKDRARQKLCETQDTMIKCGNAFGTIAMIALLATFSFSGIILALLFDKILSWEVIMVISITLGIIVYWKILSFFKNQCEESHELALQQSERLVRR